MTIDQQNLTRDDVDHLPGEALLEFGASWCGHCVSLQPHLTKLLASHPDVRYVWIEDGKGKPLGRSFAVKLWPTLIFLRDGQPIHRLVRPSSTQLEDTFALFQGERGA